MATAPCIHHGCDIHRRSVWLGNDELRPAGRAWRKRHFRTGSNWRHWQVKLNFFSPALTRSAMNSIRLCSIRQCCFDIVADVDCDWISSGIPSYLSYLLLQMCRPGFVTELNLLTVPRMKLAFSSHAFLVSAPSLSWQYHSWLANLFLHLNGILKRIFSMLRV